jgi:hypothetical protein
MTFRHALTRAAALALAFLFLSAAPALAQDLTSAETPDDQLARMTYSGFLSNAQGEPVADGAHTITFRGYSAEDDAKDGVAVMWEETHEAEVAAGRFLVVLGSQSPLTPDAEWLTVTVNDEPASAPVRFGGNPSASLAPGNTLQDSYDNGPVVNIVPGNPISFKGPSGGSASGFLVRDITTVFTNDNLTRLRLRSISGGRTWEFRVYGSTSVNPGPGAFAFSDATGSGADALTLLPGVGEDLLILDNQTVNVGSVDTQSNFQAYTTENPADPNAGFVNARIDDWFGEGGSTRLFEEDGGTHTRLEPDINGTGGFVEVQGGSGVAFTVDGNVGSGATVTIAGGTSPTVFNTALTGTGSVQLPTSAVESTEILNEAGSANNTNSSPVSLSSGFNTTLTRSITAPTAGYVIAIATSEMSTFHTGGSDSLIQFAVSRSCAAPSAPPVTQQQNTRIPGVLPTGTYTDIMSVHGLFQVNAGTTTFCSVVQLIGSTAGSIDDQNLSLIFVPSAYGGISSNLIDPPGGDESGETPSAPLTAGDVEAERAASEQANADRVRAELEEMEARLAEIEALLEGGNTR